MQDNAILVVELLVPGLLMSDMNTSSERKLAELLIG